MGARRWPRGVPLPLSGGARLAAWGLAPGEALLLRRARVSPVDAAFGSEESRESWEAETGRVRGAAGGGLGRGALPGNKEPGTSAGQRGARGAEHRLLTAPKPLTSQALPRPQDQTGTWIPQAGQTSRKHLLWFTDGSGGEGTLNHTGGHDEAGPAPGLPTRPAGYSSLHRASLPPGLPHRSGLPSSAPAPTAKPGGPRTHGPGPGPGLRMPRQGRGGPRLLLADSSAGRPRPSAWPCPFSVLCPLCSSLTHTRPLLPTCDLTLRGCGWTAPPR